MGECYMPLFSFEAMDKQGRMLKHEVEASTREEAIAKIRSMGYVPTRVSQKAQAQASESAAPVYSFEEAPEEKPSLLRRGRVSMGQIASFTVQFATLLEAGLPMVRSLRILQQQLPAGPLREQIRTVADDVEGGSSLSEALARHPKTFDKLFVAMVRAGEAGGVLDVIMRRLGEFLEKSVRLKRRIIGALIYPAIIIGVAVLVVAVVMGVIIPKFKALFEQWNVPLPYITQLLIGVSTFFVNYWYIPIGLIVALIALWKLTGLTGGGSAFFDAMKMRLPLVGDIYRKAILARFARTLGTLIASGVPLLQALSIVKEASGNVVVEKAIEGVTGSIKEGESVA
ncbi:MAG: type II secretion system F family protein, partial [Candidatus Hydrothermarchaeota archaeon]